MSRECEVYETSAMELAKKLLQADKNKVFLIAQFAPAARVLMGEKFGLARGEDALGRVSAALRVLGADVVTDGAIALDVLTLARVAEVRGKKDKGGAPVVVGKGGCKTSPMEIHARLLRNYYSKQAPDKAVRIITVACCAKAKEKISGSEVVLTVDELVALLSSAGMNVRLMKKSFIDTPFGVASGSAYICGSAGGKAEAVARCLMDEKSRAAAQKLAYSGLYGRGPVREANIQAGGQAWKFAVVACPEMGEKIYADIEQGVCEYDFVEFTKGGCISHGLEENIDKAMALRVRGLGLRYLDKSRAARSADVNAYAALALKEWQALVRSGKAYEEIPLITEEELLPPPIIEEVVEEPTEEIIEEVVEEPTEEIIEEVVEEPAEEIVEEVVEEPTEEIVEKVVEEPTEEIVEEVVEEPVEEIVEEVVEEPTEEIVEEVVEEPTEEIVEKVVEDTKEETVEEMPIVVEEVIPPVAEEVAATEELIDAEPIQDAEEIMEYDEENKRDPYHRRLSKRERSRLKKRNKK